MAGGDGESAGSSRTGGAHGLYERAVEELLFKEWRRTPFFEMGVELSTQRKYGHPGRQVLTPVNSIDLLGFRPTHDEWWVFELKRGRPADRVVGQISRYLGWAASELGSDRAVGAVVAAKGSEKLKYAVGANPNLSLWLYDDDLTLSRVA